MIFKENLIWLCAFLTVTMQCVSSKKSKMNKSNNPCDMKPRYDESFFIRQPFRKDVESTKHCDDEGTKYATIGKRRYNDATVNGCPMYFKLNFNPNRRPQFITEANCSNIHSLKNGKETEDVCRTIYYYRVVIFRKKGRRVRGFGIDCETVKPIEVNLISPKPPE